VIERLIVAFAPRMPSLPNDPRHSGTIDVLAYDDPWNGIIFADSARTEFTPLAVIQAGAQEE